MTDNACFRGFCHNIGKRSSPINPKLPLFLILLIETKNTVDIQSDPATFNTGFLINTKINTGIETATQANTATDIETAVKPNTQPYI